RLAHPLLALAAVVLPGVVEEVHAGVDGLVDDGGGLLQRRRRADVVAADADARDLHLGAPELLARDFVRAGVAQLQPGRGRGQRSARHAGRLQEGAAVGAGRSLAVVAHDRYSCRGGRYGPPASWYSISWTSF